MTTGELDAIAGMLYTSMDHGNLLRLAGLRLDQQKRYRLHAYLVAEFSLMFKAMGMSQVSLKRFQRKALGRS